MDIIILILKLVGGLGLFLYGMKVMSDALQKIAGDSMRNILAKMTSNRFRGVLTGVGVTTVIQSSSATTVMVVSFVNAGLLGLSGAIAVIMGANIGTTVTAWFVSLLGFKFSIADIAIPLIALGTPFLFTKGGRKKATGEFIIGFSLLFLGLEFLKNSVPDFTLPEYSGVLESIAGLSGNGIFSTLLFVLIGTILTVVVQSSSAMMAVTLVMCSQGLITFDVAAALVLGENIGTTITANISASMANRSAKQAARAHFIFNFIGVVWVLILFRPFIQMVSALTVSFEGISPATDRTAIPVALSLFHSLFNIINTTLLIWFVPFIIKIVTQMVPIRHEEDEEFRLRYIDGGLLAASSLTIEPAKHEIEVFSKRVLRMFTFVRDLAKETDEKQCHKLYDRIAKYEEITDRMEVEIANYLTKSSEGEQSAQTSHSISAMLRIVDNLESIGDSCKQLSISLNSKKQQKIQFSENMNSDLEYMFDLVEQALDVMHNNLCGRYNEVNLTKAINAENAINSYRDELRARHTEALKHKEYPYQIGIFYSSLYAQCEKLGDFIINVSEAIEKSNRV